MLRQLDEGRAVVELMWGQVVETARDDPATLILPLLVMPLVKDRLEAKASKFRVATAPAGNANASEVCRQTSVVAVPGSFAERNTGQCGKLVLVHSRQRAVMLCHEE